MVLKNNLFFLRYFGPRERHLVGDSGYDELENVLLLKPCSAIRSFKAQWTCSPRVERHVQRASAADGYTYAYGIAAADLNGDGNLDLTSADAEPNSNLYLLLNDGRGGFRHSFIQKYAEQDEQPIRLERHAIGDVNRDGRPDVVIVDNLKWDIRWFENPGQDAVRALEAAPRFGRERSPRLVRRRAGRSRRRRRSRRGRFELAVRQPVRLV